MQQFPTEGHVTGRFPATERSRIVTAARREASEAREALSGLCRADRYPNYDYAYARHCGYAPEQAKGLTQDFFAYILGRELIGTLSNLAPSAVGPTLP
jgi:hypothetical protein